MKKALVFALSAAAILLTSCSGKLGSLSADKFTVTPNPLETQGGKVGATISGVFPENYMKKKAVVTVIPELRFNTPNGLQAVKGQPAIFQGESVRGNNQTISYRVGGRYTMKNSFNYQPEMEQSELFLTFKAKVGNKDVKVPEVKVANGVIATSELYKRTLATVQPARALDGFQRVINQKQEASVKFLINQATLRSSELQNNSVQEFVRLLKEIAANQETLVIDGVEVSAYASPDGGYQINERLAGQRQEATATYVKQEMKKAKTDAPLDKKYTAEDWEGFQELVAASNIQDKDVILRVLSMYQDPEEREQQIKNISSAFSELADAILPQLRRARMTINYDVVGRDDQQIKTQLAADPSLLTVEELLYAATLFDDPDQAENAYRKAAQLYTRDARAFNNVALIEYEKGNYNEAAGWLEKAAVVDANLPETNANMGLIAIQQGEIEYAEELISKATGANGLNEILGNLHLAQGLYAQAEQDFGKLATNSAALAQILNKNYQAAAQTLANVRKADATTDYLTAILNARIGNKATAAQALAAAVAKDPTFAAYAAKDLELKNIQK